ncbi:putative iron-regulated membrane protein [Neokomagataea thailandica NBRC 106555]|nr:MULTISPECIES: PepSY-associated TM helix domain-containing protein [Neokomagataea]GBR49983.1 putative iron-regulated membrane protein [Neokomagataea thailandica NBRC 106555]
MIRKPEIVALYRRLHSWVGILAGLFLFIGFYAGTLTQFEEPLRGWAMHHDGLPAPVEFNRLAELRDKALVEFPEAKSGFSLNFEPNSSDPSSMNWVLQRSRDHGPGLTVYAGLDQEGHVFVKERVQPQGPRFINMLHQRIGLPLNRAWGRPVMGIVAFLYAAALISGVVVMLPSVARAMFTMRLGQGARRAWFDLHTLLGVFSLPFHIMIAVTALGFAFVEPLGMAERALFIPASGGGAHGPQGQGPQAFQGFQGEQGQQGMREREGQGREHARGNREVRMAGNQTLLTPEELVLRLKHQAPQFRPTAIDYMPNKQGYRVMVVGPDATTVTRTARGGMVPVDPYTGHITSMKDLPYKQSDAFLAATAVGGFHFGRFGGWVGHITMALMSAVGCFLFYSGNALWLASRRRKDRAAGYLTDRLGTKILSILSSGVMFGCMAGVSAVLVAMLIMPNAEYYAVCEAVFYAVFFVCLAIAGVMGGERSIPWLMRIVAFITILVPVIDVWRYSHNEHYEYFGLSLDVTALLFSLWLVQVSYGRGATRLVRDPARGLKEA